MTRPNPSRQRPTPHPRGDRWEVLVPNPARPGRYISRVFADRAAGERWQLDGYEALAAGLPVPDASLYRGPTRLPGPNGGPRPVQTVSELAWEWWRFRYADDPMSSPSRLRSTETHIRRHIAPYFDRHAPDISMVTVTVADDFMNHLAGHDIDLDAEPPASRLADAAMLTVAEAAATCSVSTSTIKRALAAGDLPNHVRTVVDGVTVFGSIRIPLGDLLGAGLHNKHAHVDDRPRRGLSQQYSREVLNTLRGVLRYARSKGLINHDPLEAVRAKKPRPAVANKKPNKARPRAITLTETRAVAAQLHIHYQVAIWLQRILGLRVSEAFGIHLGDIVDADDIGLVVIGRQGGKTFEVRSDDGEIVTVTEKEQLKNSQSYRVLGIPRPLLDFIRTYVDKYHRASDGTIKDNDRLIVGLRTPNAGGQSGYREAYEAACNNIGLDYDTLGFKMDTQHLRKSLSAELHWYVDVPEHVRSRLLGHRLRPHDGGAEMTAANYSPEMLDLAPFIQVAEKMGERIASEIGGLFVPTVKRNPPPAKKAELGHHDQSLEEEKEASFAPLLDLDSAAERLGVKPLTVRRRIQRGELDCESVIAANGRWVRLPTVDSVENLARSTDADGEKLTLNRVASILGVGYHTVYQWGRSGRITLHRDDDTGRLVIEPDDLHRELADRDRVAALRQRSMTVDEASKAIDCGFSMIHHWLRNGRLDRDPETDQIDATYVTRESVARVAIEVAAQRSKPPVDVQTPAHLVSLPEAQRLAGRTRRQIQQLVLTGDLERRDHRKRFHVTRASLERYIAEGLE